MSSQGLPFQPVITGGPPAPLESSTLSKPNLGGTDASDFGAAFRSNYLQSPVVTGLVRGWGDIQDHTMLSHDDAAKIVTAQGFDPAFIPKTGIPRGTLNLEMQRQYQVKRAQQILERGGGGGFTTNATASLAAGLTDPSNIVLGPAFGAVSDVARGGLAFRAGVGAGMGALYAGGMEAAQAHLTGHDEDIGSWEMLNHMTQSAAFFGVMHGALGPRPVAPEMANPTGGRLTLNDIAPLERSGDQAVSPAGAVGRYQIMPQTARNLGFDVTRLKEPEYNAKVAQAVLDDLQKRFPDDPTAQAVGYNASTKSLNLWLKSGRDLSKLPLETQKYLARLSQIRGGEGVPPAPSGAAPVEPTERPFMAAEEPVGEQKALAQVALSQFANDNPVSVDPFRSTAETTDPVKSAALENEQRDALPDPMRNTPAESTPPILKSYATKPPEPGEAAVRFMADAKDRITALDPQAAERYDRALKDAAAENEEGTQMSHDDFTKTVKAAALCFLSRGITNGGE